MDKRVKRGDLGINKLDAACREHDIAYSKNQSLEERHKADEILENKAWERVKSKDANFGEKTASWLVTNIMKAKRKLGMGNKQRRRRRQPQRSFKRDVVNKVSQTLKKNLNSSQLNDMSRKSLNKSSLLALRAARVAVKKFGGRKHIRIPRIIPFESKSGGILPLIPLFAGLSALGALTGGASAIAKTVIDAKNVKKKLEEDKRHNKAMEAIGKHGSGLYLRKSPNSGLGLFLKKQKNYQ